MHRQQALPEDFIVNQIALAKIQTAQYFLEWCLWNNKPMTFEMFSLPVAQGGYGRPVPSHSMEEHCRKFYSEIEEIIRCASINVC